MFGSRITKRVLWAVLAGISLMLVAQLPWVSGQLLRVGLQWSGLDISYAAYHGHWSQVVELRGLEAELDELHAHADTVRLRLHVPSMLTGHWRLRQLTVDGMDLILKRIGGDTLSTGQSEAPPLSVDSVLVRRSRVVLPDAAAELSSVYLEGTMGSPGDIHMDSAAALLKWPRGSVPFLVQGRGAVADGAIQVDTLSITGPETQIIAHGQLGSSGISNFALQAHPVKLRELVPWVPPSDESVMLGIQVGGTGGQYAVTIEGEFSDSGQLKAAVALNSNDARWRLDSLRMVEVNPALVSAGVGGSLSAQLSGELQGESLSELVGSFALAQLEGTLNGLPLSHSQADVSIEAGHVQLGLMTRFASAPLEARGEVSLESLRGRFTGEFQDFDIGQFATSQSSALQGSFSLNLGEAMVAEVDLDDGRLGRQAVEDGHLHARLDRTAFEISGHVDTDQGALEFSTSRKEDALEGRIIMEDVDLTGLSNMEVQSRINAQLQLQGRWPPDSLVLDLAVDTSMIGDRTIWAAKGQLRSVAYELDANMQLDTDAGSLAGYGHINLTSGSPVWSVPHLSFARLDTDPWGSPFTSRLQGNLELDGIGGDQATGTVTILESSVNDQVIDSARAAIKFASGNAEFSGQVNWAAGGFEFSADGESVFDNPVLEIREGAFANLNLGPLLSLEDWQTRFNGSVDSTYVQFGPVPHSNVAVNLDRSRINDLIVQQGTLEMQTADGAMGGRMELSIPDGSVRLDTLNRDREGNFEVQGTVQHLDMQALADFEANLSGSFLARGRGTAPDSLRLDQIAVSAGSSSVMGIAINDARLVGSLDSTSLVLDSLDLQTSVVRAQGQGRLARFDGQGESLEITGSLLDASPLEQWLGPVAGGGSPNDSFHVKVTSLADTLHLAASLSLGPWVWGDLRVLNTTAELAGRAVNLVPQLDSASLNTSRVSVPAIAARDAALTVRRRQDVLTVDGQVIVDDRRRAQLQGYVDPEQQLLVLEELDLRLDQDHWHLDQHAQVTAGDHYRVRNLMLVEEDQELALDGIVDFNGQQNLGLSLYNVHLDRFADLLGFEGLGGIIDGDVFLRGPADRPELEGSMTVQVRDHGRIVGALEAELGYEDHRFAVDADVSHLDGSSMQVSGYLPADLRLQKPVPMPDVGVNLALKADSLNLHWITPFLDPDMVTGLKGRFLADLNIGGTADHPILRGSAALVDTEMHLPMQGLDIADGQVRAQADGDSIHIPVLTTRSGQGVLAGQGSVILERIDRLNLDLTGTMDDFRLVDTQSLEADTDASWALTGTVTRPVLSGRLDLTGAVMRPQAGPGGIDRGPVAFTEADVQMLEQFFNIRLTELDTTTFSLNDALAMDINLGVPGNMWLRSSQNPEMDIAVAGSLRLTKAAFEDQQMVGTLSVVPQISSVHQFGRRFDIRSGRVTFTGPVLDPFFDIEAAMAVRERSSQDTPVTILLQAEGRLQETDDIVLELRSEPIELDPADILLYIATGRAAGDAFQTASTLEAGSSLAISQLNALIAGAARAGLGLDVVRIEQEGSRGLTVTAGKHISRRLFASISWPLSSDASRLGDGKALAVEYVLYPWLFARLSGDTSALGLSILSQYSW